MFNKSCGTVDWTHELPEFLHICCDTSASPYVSLMALQIVRLTKISTEQSVCQGWVAFLQQGQLVGVGQQHVSEQGRVVQALRRWSYFSGRWVGLLCSWRLPLPGAWRARHSYTTKVYSGQVCWGKSIQFTSNDSIKTSIWRKQQNICSCMVCNSSKR